MKHDNPALPDGYRLVALDSVDSTNAHAARLVEQGEAGPVWIWAGEQTAGRGRRGRDWASKPGNLYATLFLTLPVTGAVAAQLGFVAALAIHDMIGEVLSSTSALCLKWPNDVLLDGKKVSGVLSETLGEDGRGGLRIAIGCGINLAHAPQDTRYGATSISELDDGPAILPAQGLTQLARLFDHWLPLWHEGRGFEIIRQSWLDRSFAPGRPMTIRLGERDITGTFQGLTSQGALVLEELDGTRQSFHAGEVLSAALE